MIAYQWSQIEDPDRALHLCLEETFFVCLVNYWKIFLKQKKIIETHSIAI
jgi:hypothetical protein